MRFLASTAPSASVFRTSTHTPATTDPTYDPYVDPYFQADQVLNPNVMLAHDPRVIDRHRFFMSDHEINPTWIQSDNVPPGSNYVARFPFGPGYRYLFGQYRLTQATDMRIDPAETKTAFPLLPDVDTGLNQWRPLLMAGLFQRLAWQGCWLYLPPGNGRVFYDRGGGEFSGWSSPRPPFTRSPKVNQWAPGNQFGLLIDKISAKTRTQLQKFHFLQKAFHHCPGRLLAVKFWPIDRLVSGMG